MLSLSSSMEGFGTTTRDATRSKIFDLSQVGLGQPALGLENFLQKPQIFKFFYLWIVKILSDWAKKYEDTPHIYCRPYILIL